MSEDDIRSWPIDRLWEGEAVTAACEFARSEIRQYGITRVAGCSSLLEGLPLLPRGDIRRFSAPFGAAVQAEILRVLVRHGLRPEPGIRDLSPYSLASPGLSTRVANALYRNDIFTVGEVTACTAEDLSAPHMRNIGPDAVAEIRVVLAAHGLHLKDEGPDGE